MSHLMRKVKRNAVNHQDLEPQTFPTILLPEVLTISTCFVPLFVLFSFPFPFTLPYLLLPVLGLGLPSVYDFDTLYYM